MQDKKRVPKTKPESQDIEFTNVDFILIGMEILTERAEKGDEEAEEAFMKISQKIHEAAEKLRAESQDTDRQDQLEG